MARTAFATLFARLRPPDAYPGDAAADAELLRRYAEARDPAAFELLVWRHGPLVLGTCRRVARDEADAEDAFQATFLILARKAATVRQSLPNFLHRTARRAALRASQRRRPERLTADVPAATRPALDADELALLDAAIDGLGERHRRVVVLCYLQGHTTDAAATILGVPRGTVLSRLATARARLAATLTRRGLTLPTAVAASTLSFDRVSACVALTLNPRAAAPAAAIAQGVLTMMLRHQLAATAVALTLVGVGLTGTGVALMPQAGGDGPPAPAAIAAKKDDTAVAMTAVNTQIVTTERKLTDAVEQWKQTVPKVSPVNIRAKAELLSAVELLIFKSEVDVLRVDLQIEPIQKKIDTIETRILTDNGAIADFADKYAQDASAEVLKLGESMVQAEMLATAASTAINNGAPPNPNIDRLYIEYNKLRELYCVAARKELGRMNKSYQNYFASFFKSQIQPLEFGIAAERVTLSIYKQKRQALLDDLAKLEAVPPEPAAVVALRQELATLAASREALKARHLELSDPATRSAVAMEKVLLELIDLRAEVKRLRDGK